MDRRARRHPQDLVTLLRLGRLDPERVAMAGYLGDARALATGVAPWRSNRSWPARSVILMRESQLDPRERVALLLACLPARLPTLRVLENAIAKASLWAQGLLDWRPKESDCVEDVCCFFPHEAQCAWYMALYIEAAVTGREPMGPEVERGAAAARALYWAAQLERGAEWLPESTRQSDMENAFAAATAPEFARQAKVLAAALLDPSARARRLAGEQLA